MRSAVLLLLGAALAACGGGADNRPRLQPADGSALVTLAHRIGHESACAQARDIPKLTSRTVALVNAHKVPAALAEPLMSGVNALAELAPPCVPSVAPAPPVNTRGHGHGHGHGHGKGGGDGD